METNGRPRKLDIHQENILRVSIFVSRITKIITQKEIATGYNISIPTLRRYYGPEERMLSRELATKAYRHRRALEFSMHGSCAFCRKALKNHPRCIDCTVLIHDHSNDRNGGSPNMERCNSCFDTHEHHTMRPYGLVR